MRIFVATITLCVALATTAAAQPKPGQASPRPAPAPPNRVSPVPTPEAPPTPAPPSAVALEFAPGVDQPNIRFDIAIADDGGGPPPARKNLIVMVQGQGKASSRSSSVVELRPQQPGSAGPRANVYLNIDVAVAGLQLSQSDKVRARITVEYQPYVKDASSLPASVRAQVDAVLDNGKKALIWQTADPVTDRRTTIEVTATVVK